MRHAFNDIEEEDTGGYIVNLLNYYRGAVKNGTLQYHTSKKIVAVRGEPHGKRQNHDKERATQRHGIRRRVDTSPEAGPSPRNRIILTTELVDLASNELASQLSPSPRKVSSFDEEKIFNPLYNNDRNSQQREILPETDEDDEEEEQEDKEEKQEEEEQEEELQAEEEERNYEGGDECDEESQEQDGWGMVQTGRGREKSEETQSSEESTSETDDFESAP
nr:PREDICTED: myelin transcription factor 1-like [Linepithema humile]